MPADPAPNIVLIFTDDQGYGDAQSYNPNCRAPTPRIDRLAAEGCRFTDAHTSSSVCTPTRYSILTGRYNWRSRMRWGVLGGEDPMLLERDRPTAASLLRDRGYRTACIGKWHLGLGWLMEDGRPLAATKDELDVDDQERIDFSRPVSEGPNDHGFDESFILPASLDIPPYVFLENGACVERPTERSSLGVDTPYLMREGLAMPGLRAEDVLPAFAKRASEFIDEHARERPSTPFFLYFPMTAPHTPVVPERRFRGTSQGNLYTDFLAQVDDTVGQLLDALERNGMRDDTLVIFTSDNGAAPAVQLNDLAALGHEPNWPWRGAKTDVFEGGHRVPFVARWPGVTPAGSRCDATICTTDFLATAAAITGGGVPDGAGEDSVDLTPALRGEPVDEGLREATVHHSAFGKFAIRRGRWKLIEARGSGGQSFPKERDAEAAAMPELQLYDLERDPRERANLAAGHPDVVAELRGLLDRYRTEDRSVRR